MAKSLRQALRDLANARGIDGEVFEELFGLATGKIERAEHRALAIVGASLLEDALRNAIAHHLSRTRKEGSDVQLFEDEHAPLQGLSARTRIALALGILDDATKRDIDTIRAIRIAFAHSPSRITFEHDTILKSLNGINALKYLTPDYVDDLKTLAQFNFEAARFAVAVSLLCGAISLHVPFWLPDREIAKALKAASLNIPTRPDLPVQEDSDDPQSQPAPPPQSSQE
jgi:DNA-binding MltR family transcriptional regulator